ncbi:MAG: hypothetical protein ACK5H2_04640 [Beutenbergiaceae bacterium]
MDARDRVRTLRYGHRILLSAIALVGLVLVAAALAGFTQGATDLVSRLIFALTGAIGAGLAWFALRIYRRRVVLLDPVGRRIGVGSPYRPGIRWLDIDDIVLATMATTRGGGLAAVLSFNSLVLWNTSIGSTWRGFAVPTSSVEAAAIEAQRQAHPGLRRLEIQLSGLRGDAVGQIVHAVPQRAWPGNAEP